MNFTVKQIAEKYNISVHTIRYYDNEGLFPDVLRDTHGTRIFTENHLEWVYLVLCLRKTGMSVLDIKHYIELCEKGDCTITERYHIILEQKKKAQDEILEMEKKLQAISVKEKYYENLVLNHSVDKCNPASIDYISGQTCSTN